MDDVNNLMTILGFLDNYWDKLTSDLDEEQLKFLKSELEELEKKFNSAKNSEELGEISKNFIAVFSKIGPLNYFSKVSGLPDRSGALTEGEKERKIKILNYCETFAKKIDVKIGGMSGPSR